MNKRPNRTRDRALELLGQGLSERDVLTKLAAEGHKASKGSIGNWKREGAPAAASQPTAASVTPAKGKAAKGKAASGASAGAAGAPVAASDDWTLADVDLVQLPVELLERCAKAYAERLAQTVKAPVLDTAEMNALVMGHERLIKALVLARPPIPNDPEKDPSNLEQAAIAVGHIRRMIGDIRARRAAATAQGAAS